MSISGCSAAFDRITQSYSADGVAQLSWNCMLKLLIFANCCFWHFLPTLDRKMGKEMQQRPPAVLELGMMWFMVGALTPRPGHQLLFSRSRVNFQP